MDIKKIFQEIRLTDSKKNSLSDVELIKNDKVLESAKEAIRIAKSEISKNSLELISADDDKKDKEYYQKTKKAIKKAQKTIESAKDIIIHQQAQHIQILQKKVSDLEYLIRDLSDEKNQNRVDSNIDNQDKEKISTLEQRLLKLEQVLEPSMNQNQNNYYRVNQKNTHNYNESNLSINNVNLSIESEKQDIADIKEIEDFLLSKDIKIKNLPEKDESDHIINQLSIFLGDRYESLKILYSKIKRNMQRGGNFFLDLKNEPQRVVADMTQFATNLHRIAFLEQYSYQRSPHFVLRAKTTDLPKAQNFFSGQWLERFILEKVSGVIQNFGLNFNWVINPQVILPNGDDFELDLFFRVEEQFFWIEAKTGDYQQHIQKYSKISKILGLEEEHAMMILLDINRETANTLTTLFHMRVYSVDDFETGFKHLIETKFSEKIEKYLKEQQELLELESSEIKNEDEVNLDNDFKEDN